MNFDKKNLHIPTLDDFHMDENYVQSINKLLR